MVQENVRPALATKVALVMYARLARIAVTALVVMARASFIAEHLGNGA